MFVNKTESWRTKRHFWSFLRFLPYDIDFQKSWESCHLLCYRVFLIQIHKTYPDFWVKSRKFRLPPPILYVLFQLGIIFRTWRHFQDFGEIVPALKLRYSADTKTCCSWQNCRNSGKRSERFSSNFSNLELI